jgi:hypothetical protein
MVVLTHEGIIMHSTLLFLKFLSHYIDEHICDERVPYKMMYNIPICLMFSSHKVIYVETHYVHIGLAYNIRAHGNNIVSLEPF